MGVRPESRGPTTVAAPPSVSASRGATEGGDEPPGRQLYHARAGRPLLIRVPGRWVEAASIGQERRHRSEHLGGLVDLAEVLVRLEARRVARVLPAPVHEQRSSAARPQRARGPGRDEGPEAVAREDDAVIDGREQPGALRDRHDVLGQGRRVVAVRGRIREPVPAQIHRHDATGPDEPARDRRPGPGRGGKAVHEQDAASGRGSRVHPVRRRPALRRCTVPRCRPVLRRCTALRPSSSLLDRTPPAGALFLPHGGGLPPPSPRRPAVRQDPAPSRHMMSLARDEPELEAGQ